MGPPERPLRADELLVRQGGADTRSKARAMIMAGDVRIGDRVIGKPGELVPVDAVLEVRERPPYVSRGGLKLARALDVFGIDPRDMVAADIGASTGGFTDVLLQRGARRVYAIDVGYGQLDLRLRSDERVVVMERINARYLDANSLPEPVDLVVIDVSFISLELILPAVQKLLGPSGEIVALIKPQFEAGRENVGRGGIVRDPVARRAAVERVCRFAETLALRLLGLIESPIRGQSGNVEFLARFGPGPPEASERARLIAEAFQDEET